MRISADAIVAPAKLTEYLLVFRARNDKSRFLARAGFTLANPEALERAIRDLVVTNEAIEDRRDVYGTFFRVEGALTGPTGTLPVVTVWLQRSEDEQFHFVTLKPKKD